ncbi:MAG: tyrosyl-tRNA synthetase [Candidatus Kaiserbacteria bacterium]|nr:tyrosyl-tRNA synthetase [Candidatus Kaiserbacteria bacterium]
MKLSDILRERGYVYQFSGDNLETVVDTPRTLYLGVDPTADSMHVGQLMGVLVLRRFVEAGNKLIVLVGGGTGMIGDPGGKSAERNLLDDETVKHNTEALKKQFTQLLGGVPFEMVNNADWLHPLNYMEFLRDIGKHFTVNEMIKRDTIRPRLETPDQSISYTEFSYMLLQAYDFLELHTRYGCDLQVGGSDQWGNILPGVDLIRRKTGEQAYAFSWPLLVDGAGKKFGKSEGNAIWLDPKKTSPFQFYQFWLNVDDQMVHELLFKMTLLSQEEIISIMQKHSANPGERLAQKTLAHEVTALVHGPDNAEEAETASIALFGAHSFTDLDLDTVALLTREAPSCVAEPGNDLLDLLVFSTLATSKREARQFLEDGAITINGQKITESRPLEEGDFIKDVVLLRRGKRGVALLTLLQ